MGNRKSWKSGIIAACLAVSIPFFVGGTPGIGSAKAENGDYTHKEVYIGGMPAGFTLGIGGAQVIGLSQVMGEGGCFSPAAKAGLKTGDIIEKAAGIRVRNTAQLNEVIWRSGGKQTLLEVRRNGETAEVSVVPVKDAITGKYKIGILARDSVSGIGTVTYIEKESGRFGSLGHPVAAEGGTQFTGGEICSCCIVGVKKGIRGNAGELRGTFLSSERFGCGDKVTDCGIFGTVDETYSLKGNLAAYTATADEVTIGDACIYSTIDGETPKKYAIDVVKVDKNNRGNKNFVIKITDPELLEKTGGIVQGMSGSPIMQNGKLIGAVTHVFLNDPARGYGVAIETMMKSAG